MRPSGQKACGPSYQCDGTSWLPGAGGRGVTGAIHRSTLRPSRHVSGEASSKMLQFILQFKAIEHIFESSCHIFPCLIVSVAEPAPPTPGGGDKWSSEGHVWQHSSSPYHHRWTISRCMPAFPLLPDICLVHIENTITSYHPDILHTVYVSGAVAKAAVLSDTATIQQCNHSAVQKSNSPRD